MILFLPVIITKHGTQTEWKKRKGEEEEGRGRRKEGGGLMERGKKGRRRVAGKERRGRERALSICLK